MSSPDESANVAIPDANFAELAFELRMLINHEVTMNGQVEQYLARYPSKTIELSYIDMVRATERLADIYRLLRALIPLENEVRALRARCSALNTSDGSHKP